MFANEENGDAHWQKIFQFDFLSFYEQFEWFCMCVRVSQVSTLDISNVIPIHYIFDWYFNFCSSDIENYRNNEYIKNLMRLVRIKSV